MVSSHAHIVIITTFVALNISTGWILTNIKLYSMATLVMQMVKFALTEVMQIKFELTKVKQINFAPTAVMQNKFCTNGSNIANKV